MLVRLLILCGLWVALGSTALAREAAPASPAQQGNGTACVKTAKPILAAEASRAAWESAAPTDEVDEGKGEEPAGDKLAFAIARKYGELPGFLRGEAQLEVCELASKSPGLVPKARAPPTSTH